MIFLMLSLAKIIMRMFIAKLNKAVFDDIVAGKITFHRAFMTGDMTAKGNFRSLRMLDSLFEFAE